MLTILSLLARGERTPNLARISHLKAVVPCRRRRHLRRRRRRFCFRGTFLCVRRNNNNNTNNNNRDSDNNEAVKMWSWGRFLPPRRGVEAYPATLTDNRRAYARSTKRCSRRSDQRRRKLAPQSGKKDNKISSPRRRRRTCGEWKANSRHAYRQRPRD